MKLIALINCLIIGAISINFLSISTQSINFSASDKLFPIPDLLQLYLALKHRGIEEVEASTSFADAVLAKRPWSGQDQEWFRTWDWLPISFAQNTSQITTGSVKRLLPPHLLESQLYYFTC